MAPLHRQYKTARTETRRHLLLKIGQMPTQTAASRGYVLFRGAIRDTHKSPTNCLPECGHAPSECSKLGKTRIIADAATGWLEMPHFLNRMFPRHSTRNRNGMLLIILLIINCTCDMWQPLFQLPLQSVTVPALRSRTDDIRLP